MRGLSTLTTERIWEDVIDFFLILIGPMKTPCGGGGVLPIMAYPVRLGPKGVYGFHESKYMKG